MSVLIFLLVLSFLVIIHELGHYLVAKWSGVKVEEFGIGYPPRALVLFKDKAGTEYTINWLPFGGFVRLFGEDGPASVEEGNKPAKTKDEAFYTKPVWKRLLVVLAGALVNFAFGVLAFGGIYTILGIPTQGDHVLIEEVAENTPAALAGLEAGDKVVAITTGEETSEIKGVDDFIAMVVKNRGEEIELSLENKPNPVLIYVRTQEETPAEQGALGVVVSSDFSFEKYPFWQMPFRGMVVGLESALAFGRMLVEALGSMLSGLILRGDVPAEVAGPVGIAHVAQREQILTRGWVAIVNFAAILSINLAIVNVLPFPALDGGRAAFLFLELIFKRRIKPEFERLANAFGFGLLLLLIVLISARDVRNLLMDEAFRQWFSSLFS